MIKMLRFIYTVSLFSLILAAAGCSSGSVAGAVEDGNAVGGVVTAAGVPVPGAVVKLGAVGSFWGDGEVWYDTADEHGRFEFKDLNSRKYAVLCSSSSYCGYISDIAIGSTNLNILMKKSAGITAVLPVSENPRTVYITGTDIQTTVGAGESTAVFDFVPASALGPIMIRENGLDSLIAENVSPSEGEWITLGGPEVVVYYDNESYKNDSSALLKQMLASSGIRAKFIDELNYKASDTIGAAAVFFADGSIYKNSALLNDMKHLAKPLIICDDSLLTLFGLAQPDSGFGKAETVSLARTALGRNHLPDSLFALGDTVVFSYGGSVNWGIAVQQTFRSLLSFSDSGTQKDLAILFHPGDFLLSEKSPEYRLGLCLTESVRLTPEGTKIVRWLVSNIVSRTICKVHS